MEALRKGAERSPAPSEGGALVFIGFMGSGKSTAARSVAAELETEWLDSDHELERELGEPLEAFFDREGEPAFRAREEEVVLRLLSRPDARVVALGGGAVQSPRVQQALARHTVVHLDVAIDDAWRRSSGQGRPLGAAAESAGYPVLGGRGLLAAGFFPPLAGRRFVVTDEQVDRHHRIEAEERIVIMAGEEQKTIFRAEFVLRHLAQSGAERGDLLVALGGGVVGDLTGFCAAIYQRGMRYVQLPTTLVAQIDSAYGGKTGVDLPEGKNYVGAYHQPAAVITDPATLETLPAGERAAGYAEVVKTALIAGGPLWTRVRHRGEVDEEIIVGCVRTKLAIVAEDERDAGRRQVLNLGHTIAHAIEAATGYGRYRHGEAVGIGLLCALRLSGREALRREVGELLAARGLPLSFWGAGVDDVLAAVERDKKKRGGSVRFVLVEAPGRVSFGHEVELADVRAAVEEVHDR